MQRKTPADTIRSLFESTLDDDEISALIAGFEGIPAASQKSVLDLGLIISDFSVKAAAEYLRVAGETLHFISPEELPGWVGMGIAIARRSGAMGIKFFKLAPEVFSKIPDRARREAFIKRGMALTEGDVAMAYYKHAPDLFSAIPLTETEMDRWVEEGVTLGRHDLTLAVEYFALTPKLLLFLSVAHLSKWVGIATKLAAAKLFSALLFMRQGPDLFSAIPSHEARLLLLDLTDEVASHAPVLAEKLFSDAMLSLNACQPLRLEKTLLVRAVEMARFAPEIAAALFLNAPKIIKGLALSGLAGPESAATQFSSWIHQGIALLKHDADAAHGFFSFESRRAREAASQLKGGVLLSSVSRTLKLFAEALSGRTVAIAPTPQEEDPPTTDGYTLYLPSHIRHFPEDAQNFEWYKVATAYQAGYLEFGTFDLNTADLVLLMEPLQKRNDLSPEPLTLTRFLSLFQNPVLIQKLFEMAEGARIEFRLRHAYPGLAGPMNRMRETELAARPSLASLSPREAIRELLYQVSIAGRTREPIPPGLQTPLFDACQQMGAVQSMAATVVTSMKSAASVYDLLSDPVLPDFTKEMEPLEGRGEQASGQGGGGELRLSPRGRIDPGRVEAANRLIADRAQAFAKKLREVGVEVASHWMESTIASTLRGGEVTVETLSEASLRNRVMAQFLPNAPHRDQDNRPWCYDEWDCEMGEYRAGWCKVVEEKVEGNVSLSLSGYRGVTASLRAAFERLRPQGWLRLKGEREGDEIDLDRLLENRVSARLGKTPTERVYIDRQKKERSVATAFLIDFSGSTKQQISGRGKSVLQVEKEALILLSRAVETVGDTFALYGFAGQGKDAVRFYLLKDFDEPYHAVTEGRIGSMDAAFQNRDGTAIRHAARKLAAERARIKLLILLSDGRPLDQDYTGSYAVADTKMALAEARRMGIHPFCVTVDVRGEEYLKGMYGEGAYTVIDRVEMLPIRLPQIYKRLTT